MADLLTPPANEIEEFDPRSVIEEPLWRVRLRLGWRAFRKNWALFSENKMGIAGLLIIALFGIMALAHPVLMATVWQDHLEGGKSVYDIRAGADSVIVEKTIVEEVTDPLTQISQIEAMFMGTGVSIPQFGDTIEVPLANPAPPVLTGVKHPHILGTDPFGADVFSQLLFGARAAFLLGAIAAISSVALATLVGTISAYFGGVIDTVLMRLADLVILIPLLPLLIVVSGFWNVELTMLGILIGVLGGLGGTAIILKSQALSVKVKPFIDAARIAGGGHWRIITRHIIPNVLPLSFLYMMFAVTGAIFTEAALSFLGLLNIQQSWGIMINIAHTQGYTLEGVDVWWLMFPAGLSITLFSAGFFLVGRAMDEVVNPRLRKR
ncbi:MAG: ABC transporter permease subunit [Acidimicrobiia bacterium]|nr:ABC transporter permease subunit [Acidimicrobiia bacterium]